MFYEFSFVFGYFVLDQTIKSFDVIKETFFYRGQDFFRVQSDEKQYGRFRNECVCRDTAGTVLGHD